MATNLFIRDSATNIILWSGFLSEEHIPFHAYWNVLNKWSGRSLSEAMTNLENTIKELQNEANSATNKEIACLSNDAFLQSLRVMVKDINDQCFNDILKARLTDEIVGGESYKQAIISWKNAICYDVPYTDDTRIDGPYVKDTYSDTPAYEFVRYYPPEVEFSQEDIKCKYIKEWIEAKKLKESQEKTVDLQHSIAIAKKVIEDMQKNKPHIDNLDKPGSTHRSQKVIDYTADDEHSDIEI